MKTEQLKIDHIDVLYGSVEAVRDVSLHVYRGEVITLIGANGAGKSTTINTISGILQPAKGDVLYEGASLRGMKPKKIVGMGIAQVPEGRRIFPHLTVLENLKMGAYLQKDSKKIQATLEMVYRYFSILKNRQQQSGGSLSGGEQQMVAIGRALMTDPKLLLMDEPTLGLSPILRQELVKLIKAINETGVTMLLVEQNARMALGLADRGYVMETGRIVKEGNGRDLLNDPKVKEAYLGG